METTKCHFLIEALPSSQKKLWSLILCFSFIMLIIILVYCVCMCVCMINISFCAFIHYKFYPILYIPLLTSFILYIMFLRYINFFSFLVALQQVEFPGQGWGMSFLMHTAVHLFVLLGHISLYDCTNIFSSNLLSVDIFPLWCIFPSQSRLSWTFFSISGCIGAKISINHVLMNELRYPTLSLFST